MGKLNRIYILITISLLIIALDFFGFLSFLKGPFDRLIIPLKKDIFLSSSKLKDVVMVTRNYSNLVEFYAENASLNQKNEELQIKVRQLESENQKMRLLLGAPFPASYKFLPASVITVGRFMEIAQGENQGVRKGQIVIDGQTLIGIVETVSPERTQVKLLTDPEFQIPAVTSRDTHGLVVGQGEQNVSLTRVLQKDPLFQNDQVVTAGAEFTPANLLIGKVTHITSDETAAYKQAKIVPIIDFTREKIVFVITSL